MIGGNDTTTFARFILLLSSICVSACVCVCMCTCIYTYECVSGMMEDHKKHRIKKAGPKAERKKERKLPTDLESAKKRNPKAFAIQSAVKAAKKFHR